MFDMIRMRVLHGNPAVPDLRKASVSDPFISYPAIDASHCKDCPETCASICPTTAIGLNPLRIDLGMCILCGDCAEYCGNQAISFESRVRTYSTERESLVVRANTTYESYIGRAMKLAGARNILGKRSLRLRQVSAGGCNGCELELGACTNVNFDMGRFGIEWVASPRHADGIVITGPISSNMEKALFDTYEAVPNPKIVVACGTCATGGGLFAASPEISRRFFAEHKPDLFIPGCPPHPLTVINGLYDLLHL
jgi:Ni,Fe-hydrogenase III small subunit/NAD-dependent dihydropyrimidine dehydrogenase PreA subunit